MAKLNANTVVIHPETGAPAVLEAGSDVPDWAKDLGGDHLIGEPAAAAEPEQTGGSAGEQPAGNASREAWAAYAMSKGATEDELKDPSEGGLGRDELRAKYGA